MSHRANFHRRNLFPAPNGLTHEPLPICAHSPFCVTRSSTYCSPIGTSADEFTAIVSLQAVGRQQSHVIPLVLTGKKVKVDGDILFSPGMSLSADEDDVFSCSVQCST